jgi:hypothetical protein
MAYNTKAIKTDLNAKPIPQYYNPVTDEYEVLQGVGGAARQVLYGPDGQPIATTEGKLAVRATELEEKIEAVRVLLNALAGEDFATQTTLAQILGKMIAAPATEAKQDVIAGHVDGVETLLTALKEKDFATETKLEAVRVLLNSLAGEDFATSAKQAEILAALGKQSTAAKQDALAGLVGALDAEAVSDPAAAGAVIALLKGLLSRLQTLENKIDSFTTGEETVNTELKGSLVQNAFEIIPSDAADLTHETIAIYVGFDGDLKIDLVNGETITMYNLAAGAWHPIQAKRVYATGTTATYILGAY